MTAEVVSHSAVILQDIYGVCIVNATEGFNMDVNNIIIIMVNIYVGLRLVHCTIYVSYI